jgi:hypothetical protein
MNKILKKLVIGGIIVTQLITVSTPVFAEVDSYTADGDLSLAKCFSKGGFDFVSFMQAATFVDTFDEAMLQPWIDVLWRNQCQALDLIRLIDQQDAAKSQIRDAFLTCNTEKIPELRKRYYEFTVEIYYARHIVDESAIKDLTDDLRKDPGILENVFTKRAEIYTDMKERYVITDYFTQEEFDDFFEELVSKYADRVYDYVSCEGGSWSEVAEKWEEFKKHFTEDLGGLKEFGEGVAGEWKNITNELKTMKVVSLLKGEESFGAFLGSFVDTSINGLNFDDFADEFSEDAMKNIPNFNVSTQRDFVTSVQSSAKGFELEQIEKEMKANFGILYGTTGDESIELFLTHLDGTADDDENNGLIEITTNSYPNLTKMQGDIDVILGKQCE